MSEHTEENQGAGAASDAPAGDLQFDKAEYAEDEPAGLACAACKRPIEGPYHQLNAAPICDGCRAAVGGVMARSVGPRAFARAMGLGLAAALLGTLIYFGVSALTGYEFSLVAILVGFLVGKAVLRGSFGRGGRRYQVLAMVLTYCSIAATNLPPIIKELSKKPAEQAAAAAPAGAEKAPAPAAAEASPGVGELFLALGVLLLLALASPFLAGVQNILGIAIIAFGVYEAWRINQAVPLVLTGPYELAPAAASEGADPQDD